MARILLMEDENWQVKVVIRVLEVEFGHMVMFCSTIEATDKNLRSERFDIAIVDVMMDTKGPIRYETSAFVILERIRKGDYELAGNSKNLPVVFATGVKAMEMTWKDGETIPVAEGIRRMAGHDAICVNKPFMAENLDEAVKTAIKRCEAED